MVQEPAAKGGSAGVGTAQSDTYNPLQHHFFSYPLPPVALPDNSRFNRRGFKRLIAGRAPNPQQSSIGRPSGPPVIKTKFAISRIKRIIQADKEIGKLAKVEFCPRLTAAKIPDTLLIWCGK